MEEQKIDRRVRKTKSQLRQALMQLMTEKPFKSISVRELSERADINRGTFYIHYRDVSDLLQRLEDEMAERLIEVCKKYAYTDTAVEAFPYLTDIFRFFHILMYHIFHNFIPLSFTMYSFRITITFPTEKFCQNPSPG